MSWKHEVFSNFKLYAVTNFDSDLPENLEKVEAAYKGGADIIQLRSKSLSDAVLYRIGIQIRKIADARKKLFFVNDRPGIALAVKADGIHLGQEDLPVSAVRNLFSDAGRQLWIGKSTHSLKQGLAALKEKPDYIGVGPIFKTPTKPDYEPAGLEYLRLAVAKIKIPLVAIGGINQSNIDQVLQAGARRIAVVRAIFDAPDVRKATAKLRKSIEDFTDDKN